MIERERLLSTMTPVDMADEILRLRAENLDLRLRAVKAADHSPVTVREVVSGAVQVALHAAGGNREAAARRLGVGERTLYRWLSRGLPTNFGRPMAQ